MEVSEYKSKLKDWGGVGEARDGDLLKKKRKTKWRIRDRGGGGGMLNDESLKQFMRTVKQRGRKRISLWMGEKGLFLFFSCLLLIY